MPSRRLPSALPQPLLQWANGNEIANGSADCLLWGRFTNWKRGGRALTWPTKPEGIINKNFRFGSFPLTKGKPTLGYAKEREREGAMEQEKTPGKTRPCPLESDNQTVPSADHGKSGEVVEPSHEESRIGCLKGGGSRLRLPTSTYYCKVCTISLMFTRSLRPLARH